MSLNETDGQVLDVHSMTIDIDQPQSILEKMSFVASPVKLREALITLLWGKRG